MLFKEIIGVYSENRTRPINTNADLLIIIIIWLYSPERALASPFCGSVTITFLQGWIVSPTPNPQPGGPPRRQGDPAIPPVNGYPF
jgi:hypothetical protein